MKKLLLLIIPIFILACNDDTEPTANPSSNNTNINEVIYGNWTRSSSIENSEERRDSLIRYHFDEDGYSYICTVDIEDKVNLSSWTIEAKKGGEFNLYTHSASDISDCTHQLVFGSFDAKDTIDACVHNDSFILFHRQTDGIWEESFGVDSLNYVE